MLIQAVKDRPSIIKDTWKHFLFKCLKLGKKELIQNIWQKGRERRKNRESEKQATSHCHCLWRLALGMVASPPIEPGSCRLPLLPMGNSDFRRWGELYFLDVFLSVHMKHFCSLNHRISRDVFKRRVKSFSSVFITLWVLSTVHWFYLAPLWAQIVALCWNSESFIALLQYLTNLYWQ